eukprot:m.39679 g.39679  ORF g.39679 m.39679 type:complete len:112 (+) comp10340_c0_seq3:240-575(+)
MMTTTKAIQDRVPGVAMPAIDVLTEEQVFPNGTDQPPDHTVLREHFIQEGVIEDTVARLIIKKTTKLLQQEPNLLDLAEPISSMAYKYCVHTMPHLTVPFDSCICSTSNIV